MHEAFYIARTGRPGPVLIDVTKDVQQARLDPDWDVGAAICRVPPSAHGSRRRSREPRDCSHQPQRPLIMWGTA